MGIEEKGIDLGFEDLLEREPDVSSELDVYSRILRLIDQRDSRVSGSSFDVDREILDELQGYWKVRD